MSFFIKKEMPSKGQLGIWRIEEEERFFKNELPLSSANEANLAKKHPSRRLEWLAGRYLLHEMSEGKPCQVDEYGKPFLENSPYHVSISHSGDLASVVMNHKSVGVDIQKITTKIQRIARKFMRAEEMDSLEKGTELEHLHVYWGAKEALYKAYGKKQLDFREHLHVKPFVYQSHGGQSTAIVTKGDYKNTYEVHYQKIENYILVYVVENGV
jgi:phosphopantetheine--protein transferase-like protein